MANTEQQFMDAYKGMTAEQQQKTYKAADSTVKGWIDNYNTQKATTGTTTQPAQQVSNNQNSGTVQPSVSSQENQNNNIIPQQGALKPKTQDYYNQTDIEAQERIVANLNNYKQSNPEYFADYESFKRNFSYDARNETQKNLLDTWYEGYQKSLGLNSKSVSDLATQYKNGLISDGDLEQIRATNGQKYGEVMDYINKQTILSKYDDEQNIATSTNPFQDIINQYYNNLLNASRTNATSEMFDNYKNQMNSPEMTELSDQLAEKEGQINEYQRQLNRIKSDVEKRYEGTGASKSKINAIIADESYKIQELMGTASLEYNTLATKYNNRMSQYQNEFQLQLQEYQYAMQERNMQMQELGFMMDLMNFETNEQKDEREWNNYVRQYDYQYGNINSKDPASRRRAIENAVDSVLSEFEGITMVRSRDQMVEDIKKLVDGGMSLGEAITQNIRKPIMQKPEYTTWQAAKYGGLQSSYNSFTVGNSTYTIDSQGKVTYSPNVTSYEGTGMKGLGLKNNNPGNIKDTGFNSSKVLGTDAKGFAIFATPEDGFDALVEKIQNVQKGGSKTYSANDTLAQFINKYAPSSDGNNPKAYAQSVANQLGVSMYTKIKDLDATQLAAAIAKHDSGYDYSTYGQFRGNVNVGSNTTGLSNDQLITLAQQYNDGTRTYSDIKATYGDDVLSLVGKVALTLKNGDTLGTNVETQTEGGQLMTDYGVPLTYHLAVWNTIPTQEKNNVAEADNIRKIIKNMYDTGIPETTAALYYQGYNVTNPDDINLANEIVSITRTLGLNDGEIKTISDLINAGKYENAIKMVENKVTAVAKNNEDYISESATRNMVELLNTINSVQENPLGLYTGTVQKWLKQLGTAEAQEVQSLLSQLKIDAQNNGISEDLVPNINDKASVFYTKLQNLYNKSLNKLNNWRMVYNLPALNNDTLANYNSRVNLYRGTNTTNSTYSSGYNFSSVGTSDTNSTTVNGVTYTW